MTRWNLLQLVAVPGIVGDGTFDVGVGVPLVVVAETRAGVQESGNCVELGDGASMSGVQ